MKYRNKKNGEVIMMVSDIDPKTKTVMIRNLETGKERPVSTATIKRWYEVVEEQETTEPETEEQAEAEELENQEPETVTDMETTEPETVEEQEPEPEKKEKKERKQREKKVMKVDAASLHEYVLATCEQLGGTVFIPAKEMKFRGLKCGGHMFVKYSWGNNNIVLQVRSKALGLDAPKNPCNHTFDDKYKFGSDTAENRAEIYKIMKACYDWQATKNEMKNNKKGETA